MFKAIKRLLLIPAALFALMLTATACASTPAEPTVTVSADAIVIDVRTPAEYAGGHLEGAELLDLNGGQLAAAIPSLDPDAEYFVYCRSGNRSAQAMALMQQAGITNITNLGSVDSAAKATGIPIVK